jgi:type IV pilus assembly protein PilB
MVNMLISEGIRTGASDIHIEPGMDGVAVRNRIDGILRDTLTMPREIHAGLVSRLKILAHLDIAERRRPQDGRIRVSTGAHAVDLRVSTLPTHCGEKVVLRLLDGERDVLGLEHLGLEAAQRRILDEALAQPQGSILVTGPTGSGKTSTLYAALSYLKSPGINIVSLENPVEFQIKGVNQVNMNERTGLTFAASLRSIVRQDPDVIMVGEIRDAETAEIAFQAALTGHLVLSTLHTNSASAAVTRLFDLGVEPFLVASSVSLVIAQRLVRRLCVHCREAYDPTLQELERLHLKHQTTPLYRPRGCERCLGTGFKGRVAVFEFMPLDERMRELISARASEATLQREMHARGLASLVEAAAVKVRAGVTGTDEVARVILHEEGSRKGCPSCGEQIEASFAVCPACETPLKARCGECQQDLQPQWRVCPFCSAPTRSTPRLAANGQPRGVRRGPSNDASRPA